jgi:3-dehydroquinate synthetase
LHEQPIDFGAVKTPYVYGIDCVDGVLDAFARHVSGASSAVFAIDQRVVSAAEPLITQLSQYVPVHPYVVVSAERHKRLGRVEDLLEYALRVGADRRSVMVAMGGGLVGNIAGLAAALLFRGIRLAHLPTTPVAAFDSVLSQKQAVNLTGGKNLSGTYHAPSLIACDLRWLTTIPRRDLLTGIAEMVKNVLAVQPQREAALLRALDDLAHRPTDAFATLCELGIAAKAPLLVHDPRERHAALIFEYGHTVGHALETVTAGAIGHGEAIAWGMLVAAEVSAAMGQLSRAAVDHHYLLISHLSLATASETLGPIDRQALRAALRADNKRGYLPGDCDGIAMVLLAAPGVPVPGPGSRPLCAVPEDVVLAAFDTVAAEMRLSVG